MEHALVQHMKYEEMMIRSHMLKSFRSESITSEYRSSSHERRATMAKRSSNQRQIRRSLRLAVRTRYRLRHWKLIQLLTTF
jgi:hypothetical protein